MKAILIILLVILAIAAVYYIAHRVARRRGR